MSDTRADPNGHDRLLDAVKSIAIVRVVLWHTLSWAWLSWIPAMPAMFFTNGALLERSVERKGWSSTLRERARRLLVPYWCYAAACWIVMVASGWNPRPVDALTWALPLIDPVGSESMPGLWVPLWYVRAYIWFVLGSGLLKRVEARLGAWTVILSAVSALTMWGGAHFGHDLPFAISDAFAYLPFVMAGMVYRSRGRLGGSRVISVVGLASAALSLLAWRRFGPADGVVNRSYLLMLLVGGAGIAFAVALRSRVVSGLDAAPRIGRVVATLNSRALTIYLWQGFGLVAADRLLSNRASNRLVAPVLSVAVVSLVVCGAVVVFGPLEDLAARRIPVAGLHRGLGRQGIAGRRKLVRVGSFVAALSLVAFAVVMPTPGGSQAAAPLSGNAVVARAGLVEEALHAKDVASSSDGAHADASGSAARDSDDLNAQSGSPQAILDRWISDNAGSLDDLGLTYVDAVIVGPDGDTQSALWGEATHRDEPLLWWSMTKTVTVAWMMRLEQAGILAPDDKLARWVPEVPNAKRITLEQLARHSSGIPTSLDSPLLEARPAAEIARYKRSGRLAFEPGSGFAYSRIGYLLLGLALERASGTTWTDAVAEMADQAGVRIGFDQDLSPNDEVTDPDHHGYRGALWSAGGLVSSTVDAAGLLRWIFTQGLSPESVDTMSAFSPDPEHWYYGLGLIPLCPCEHKGDTLSAARFGLDSATGTFAVDRNGAVVLIRSNNWFRGEIPAREFYDLEGRLLNSTSEVQPR